MSRHPDRRTRRRFTPQQKANVVRRRLADKMAVSSVAVSSVVVEDMAMPNTFIWMQRGELHLRDFRLRIYSED